MLDQLRTIVSVVTNLASNLAPNKSDGSDPDLPQLRQALQQAWSVLAQLNDETAATDNGESPSLPTELSQKSQEFADLLLNCCLELPSTQLKILTACCLMELFKLHCPDNPFVGRPNEAEKVCRTIDFIARVATRVSGSRGAALGYLMRNIIGTDLPLALGPYAVGSHREQSEAAAVACVRCLLEAEPSAAKWDWPGGAAVGLSAALTSLHRLLDEAPELITQSTLAVGALLDSCVAKATASSIDHVEDCLAAKFLSKHFSSLSRLIADELEARMLQSLQGHDDVQQKVSNKPVVDKSDESASDQLVLLLRIAHRICPAELVIPSLCARIILPRLRSQLVADRLRACRRLCRLMLVGIDDGVARRSFVDGGWRALVARFGDVSPVIRRFCLLAVPQLCTFTDVRNREIQHGDSEALDNLRQMFQLRAIDTEESVRLALVSALDALPSSFETEFRITILIARSRDLSSRVRLRAIASLAKLSTISTIIDPSSVTSGALDGPCPTTDAANAVMSAHRSHPLEVERHLTCSLLKVWTKPDCSTTGTAALTPVQSAAVLLHRWRGFFTLGASGLNATTTTTTKAAGAFVLMLKSLWHIDQICRQTLAYLESATSAKSANSLTWLSTRMRSLATYFPMSHHSTTIIQQSLLNALKRLASLASSLDLRRLLAPECDLHTANRLRRRILLAADASSAPAAEASLIEALLTRLGPVIVDGATLTAAIELAKPGCLVDLQLVNAFTFYRPDLLIDAQPLLDFLTASLDAPSPSATSTSRPDTKLQQACLRLLDSALSTPAGAALATSAAVDSLIARLVSLCQSVESSVTKAAISCLATLSNLGNRRGTDLAWLAEAALTADWKSAAAPTHLLESFGHLMKSSLAERLGLLQLDRIGQFIGQKLLPLILEGPPADVDRDANDNGDNSEVSSVATDVRLAAVRCLTRCLVGMKQYTSEDPDCAPTDTEDSDDLIAWHSTVNQAIDSLHFLLLHEGGTITISDQVRPNAESKSRSLIRRCAARRLLGLARHRAYQRRLTQPERMQTVAYTVTCDPCHQLRCELLLDKLHNSLMRLRLPVDYLAIYAFVTESGVTEFQRKAADSLRQVVAKRRESMAANWDQVSKDKRLFYSLLPEACLAHAIYLWANDVDFQNPSSLTQLARPLAGLRFLLRPLLACTANISDSALAGGHNFTWLRRLLEKIRSARDCRHPDSDLSAARLRAVADLTFGLVATMSSRLTFAQLPFEPQLPKKLFVFLSSSSSGGGKVWPEFASLPAELRFGWPHCKEALTSGVLPACRVQQQQQQQQRARRIRGGKKNPEASDDEEENNYCSDSSKSSISKASAPENHRNEDHCSAHNEAVPRKRVRHSK